MSIYDGTDVTVGVFIIRPGCRIPLHNHPSMHGIIKCLAGSLHVSSFSLLSEAEARSAVAAEAAENLRRERWREIKNGSIFPVKPNRPVTLHPGSTCACLTPTDGNLHEITAGADAAAAFFDVLAPPYNSGEYDAAAANSGDECRECDFFAELPYRRTAELPPSEAGVRWIGLLDGSPEDYFCDNEPYRGPDVSAIAVEHRDMQGLMKDLPHE